MELVIIISILIAVISVFVSCLMGDNTQDT